MKLAENRYIDQAGLERVEYKVGKKNEFEEGISVDTKIDFELSFPPTIKAIQFTDKKTKQLKTFESVKILAKPSVEFENVVLHEQYGNATFQLASNYADWIAECQQGDVLTVWLRSFEIIDKETGKPKRLSAWDCNINGVNVKKGVPQKQTTLTEQPLKDVPEELTEWATKLLADKEGFIAAFCQDDGTTFIDWVTNAEYCETDYFVNQGEDLEEEAKLVLEILKSKL